jgi:threonine/homoserine/homoserine lactone efflux protein
MPDITTLAVFAVASLMLLVIPGPTVMYIVARGLHQGRAAALVSALGVEVGTLIQLLVATFGLAALVGSSETAFTTLKHLGSAYLVWLCVNALLESSEAVAAERQAPAAFKPIFLQGVLVEALNPKTAIFFIAFLPQFADPARGPVEAQILMLGALFILLAIFNDGLIGLLAGSLGERLRTSARVLAAQRYVAGSVYLSLATFTTLQSPALY